MKKVLVISNPYKPMDTIGTKRIMKFLKYMKGSEWEPVVVAPKVQEAEEYDKNQYFETIRVPFIGPERFYSLARKMIPSRSKNFNKNEGNGLASQNGLSRGRSYVFNKWLFIPDDSIFWAIFAASKAIRYIKKHSIDLCFVSGPEYSTFLAGVIVSKRTNIKLITDFRDPWIDSEFNEYKTGLHYAANRSLEKRVVQQSEKVITVAPFIRDLFIKRYRKEPEEKFKVLYNGYDSDDIAIAEEKTIPDQSSEALVITHTGKFYGQKNPGSFLKGLAIAKGKQPAMNIKVQFVGGVESSYIDYANEHNLDVIDVGRVPYDESLAFQRNSNLLLLVPGPGKGTITGKFFEYLSAKRPILCAGIPGSDLEQLLKQTNSGVIADVQSPNDIAEKITKLYQMFRSGKNLYSFSNSESFDFRSITNKLLNIFNEETK